MGEISLENGARARASCWFEDLAAESQFTAANPNTAHNPLATQSPAHQSLFIGEQQAQAHSRPGLVTSPATCWSCACAAVSPIFRCPPTTRPCFVHLCFWVTSPTESDQSQSEICCSSADRGCLMQKGSKMILYRVYTRVCEIVLLYEPDDGLISLKWSWPKLHHFNNQDWEIDGSRNLECYFVTSEYIRNFTG